MNPNQPNKRDVPSVKGEIKPESDPSVVTEGTKPDWQAVNDAADRAKALEAESNPDEMMDAIVTSQVMLGQDYDARGNLLTTGKIAKRGEKIKVTRAFFRKFRGHFVETPAEFERQEKKARGEEDF